MKKIFKVLAIIAIVALIGFSFAACSGEADDGDPISGFTSISAFKTWLDAQPDNTAATAYSVKLKVSSLGVYNYMNMTDGRAGKVLLDNKTKYISLDLSGSKITDIGYEAFFGCTNLTSVTIPDSVTYIGDRAFYGCTSLTGITIPNSVTQIQTWAFGGCTGLTSVTIPNSVTYIRGPFPGCTSLTTINIDADNSAYIFDNGILYDKSKNTLIQYLAGKTSSTFTIPDSVTSIGDCAFVGCTSLTSVTIPDGVTSIGDNAFSGLEGLTSVTIPGSVTRIGYFAFSGCTSLTSVTFAAGSNITGTHIDNGETYDNFGNWVFPDDDYGNTLKTAYSRKKAGTYLKDNGTWS